MLRNSGVRSWIDAAAMVGEVRIRARVRADASERGEGGEGGQWTVEEKDLARVGGARGRDCAGDRNFSATGDPRPGRNAVKNVTGGRGDVDRLCAG